MTREEYIKQFVQYFHNNETFSFYGKDVFIVNHIMGLTYENLIYHDFRLSDDTNIQFILEK